jgi:glycosidase
MKLAILVIIFSLLALLSCNSAAKDTTEMPGWAVNKVIYELNIRQFSPEGTFNAATERLDELQELGVGILWLMPIQPIGAEKRKGRLGSYYSIRDYVGLNPEFGTSEDFRRFMNEAHKRDMRVILDWVANHSSWDNHLITDHPDWYTHNEEGEIIPPVADWSDVADLNYDRPQLRDYMYNAMKYWVTEFDMDGFRCDVAEMVPHDFWSAAISKLNADKPLLWLAEGSHPDLHKAGFHLTYSWDTYYLLQDIYKGKKSGMDLFAMLDKEAAELPEGAMRMRFITNHDENSWNGTLMEQLGQSEQVMTAVYYALPGKPLIYTGQEAGLNKRLRFFDKDTIDWSDTSRRPLFRNLNQAYSQNEALYKGAIRPIATGADSNLVAFQRFAGDQSFTFVFNLNPEIRDLTVHEALAISGRNIMTAAPVQWQKGQKLTLPAYGFLAIKEH